MTTSPSTKVAVLFVLAVSLQLGLSAVRGVVQERQNYRLEAEQSIKRGWAGSQFIRGPILKLRYSQEKSIARHNPHLDAQEALTQTREVHEVVLPEELKGTLTAEVEERYRGIFKFPVYTATVSLEGRFSLPASTVESLRRNGSGEVEIRLSDGRGLNSVGAMQWNGRRQTAKPGLKGSQASDGFHVPLNSADFDGELLPFRIEFEVKGLNQLQVAAIGQSSEISFEANWPHPKFVGEFLPSTRSIAQDSFEARWSLNHFATGIAQVQSRELKAPCEYEEQALGVEFFEPVDRYHSSERALKYGILFIVLSFGSFFLVELLYSLRIHPIQYLLVGALQVIFYLLLLSISEYLSFGGAYAIATVACALVVTRYLQSVLQSKNRGLSFGGAYVTLYAVLYVVLQSSDYALLLGSALLFSAVSACMLLTRGVDWYALGALKEAEVSSEPSQE